jgi:hypothetical protein
MGTDEAGEGGGGQAEGAQEVDGLTIGVGLAEGEDALHGLADQGDLGVEIEGEGSPFGRRGCGAVGSVEAVLEGVAVARLTTAATMGGGRGGHETVMELIPIN